MGVSSARMRQVVDWRAALVAGVVAGIVFLLLNLLLAPVFAGVSAGIFIRMLASIVMGEGVLPPPTTIDPVITLVALLTHFILSIIFAIVLAIIIHRWGLITGILLGGVFGLALYGINFFTMTYFFPWFFAMNHWIIAVTHVIFGAVAGGVYEALEVERFVPVENDRSDLS